MSLLANANARIQKYDGTAADQEDGLIHLKLFTTHAGSTLVVECQDTGCFTMEWEGSLEFHNPRSLLYPVRKICRSLGGDCGMRLGCFAEEHGGTGDDKAGDLTTVSKTILWSVTLMDPLYGSTRAVPSWLRKGQSSDPFASLIKSQEKRPLPNRTSKCYKT